VSGRRHTIQGTIAISDKWVLATIDAHDLQTHLELYLIVGPLLAAFSSLIVTISLTLDGWSNHNLKGFYVVIAH
jgi:hypothetical protein